MTRFTKHLTYANVMSTLCLLLIVGTGTAYAANTIGSSDIIDESILSQDIKNAEVMNAELAANSVTSGKIYPNSVNDTDIRTDAVTSSEVLLDSLTAADLAANSVTASELAPNAVTSPKVGANALTGADINESTLAGVNAGTVDGMSVKKINFQVPYGTAKQPILSFPGKFTIYGECQDFGDQLDVNAVTTEPNSKILVFAGQAAFDDIDTYRDAAVSGDNFFQPNEEFQIDNVFVSFSTVLQWVRIDFSTPSGFVAHIDLLLTFSETPSGCVVTGTAVGG